MQTLVYILNMHHHLYAVSCFVLGFFCFTIYIHQTARPLLTQMSSSTVVIHYLGYNISALCLLHLQSMPFEIQPPSVNNDRLGQKRRAEFIY